MKVFLNHTNKNPVSQIPDWYVQKLKERFPEIVIIEEASGLIKLSEADYILGWGFPGTFLKRCKKLKQVFLYSSQIPESFQGKDFSVQGIAGLNAEFVADYIEEVLNKHQRLGKILILGSGHIGREVFHRLSDKEVCVLTRTPQGQGQFGYDKMADLLRDSEVVIPCLSYNGETRELFSRENFFQNLRDDVLLINTTRGKMIAEPELVEFFGARKNAFYHTDVTHPEPYPEEGALRGLSNCTITNHIAGFGDGLWEKIWEKQETLTKDWP